MALTWALTWHLLGQQIAEEVAEVLPTLVTYDEDGQPTTVRYDLLTALLLNEVQRQENALTVQNEELRKQRSEMEELRKELANLKRKKRFRSD